MADDDEPSNGTSSTTSSSTNTRGSRTETQVRRVPNDVVYKVKQGPKIIISRNDKTQYMLGNTLGEGSYAKVREAIDMCNLRRVAVKIMKQRQLRKIPGGEGVLQKEISIMEHLYHTNVVQLLNHWINDETEKYYIVLEYIHGWTLTEMVENAGEQRLPLFQARSLLVHLLNGIDYLHKRGVVHRDIKPDNLLVTVDGVLKITDFGVAKQLLSDEDDLNSRNGNTGSPAFQPPEIASGAESFSGFKMDIWAAGITLFIMVVGKFPFEAENPIGLFERIAAGDYTVPPWVSASLADLICSVLCVDKELRFTVEQIRAHAWMSEPLQKEERLPPHRFQSAFTDDQIKSMSPVGRPDDPEFDEVDWFGEGPNNDDEDFVKAPAPAGSTGYGGSRGRKHSKVKKCLLL